MDNAIETGLLFWKLDDFDQRVVSEVNPSEESGKLKNKRSYKYFYDRVLSMRKRKNIAEIVQSMGLTLKSLIKQYQKTKDEQKFEYLT